VHHLRGGRQPLKPVSVQAPQTSEAAWRVNWSEADQEFIKLVEDA
jgi:hypothetical protein